MEKIGIVTDSHCSIAKEEAKRLGIWVLPMPFYIEDECFYEDVTLSRQMFFEKLDLGVKISTSQPAPGDVMKIWDQALLCCEEILYIPLSSGLSGSCQTASLLAQEEPYAGRVFVVDNGRVATLLHRSILDAKELIAEGYSAAEIKEILEKYRDKMNIYIAVENLEYLKRGGRVSAATAALSSILNIKPVLEFDVGTLDTYKKCRGMEKAKKAMLEAVHHDFETRFSEWKERDEIYLVAASSATPEAKDVWVREIEEAFPGMPVLYDDLSLGLSCHIGPGGLGIGYSCRPRRPEKHH